MVNTIFKEYNKVSTQELNIIKSNCKIVRTFFEDNQLGDTVYYFDVENSFTECNNVVNKLNEIDDYWFVVDDEIE